MCEHEWLIAALSGLGHGVLMCFNKGPHSAAVIFNPVILPPLSPLCSASLQALCAVGFCGGHNLLNQSCQEEGESLDHPVRSTHDAKVRFFLTPSKA